MRNILTSSPKAWRAETGGVQLSHARVSWMSSCSDPSSLRAISSLSNSAAARASSAGGTGNSRAGRPSASAIISSNCGVETSSASPASKVCLAAAAFQKPSSGGNRAAVEGLAAVEVLRRGAIVLHRAGQCRLDRLDRVLLQGDGQFVQQGLQFDLGNERLAAA